MFIIEIEFDMFKKFLSSNLRCGFVDNGRERENKWKYKFGMRAIDGGILL